MAQFVSAAADVDTEVPLSIVQGDAEDILITVTEPDPASTDAAPLPDRTVDLSRATDTTPGRPAIIRAAIKRRPQAQSNADAFGIYYSYTNEEIQILDQAVAALAGKALWRIDVPDTDHPIKPRSDYRYDVVITRQDILRQPANTGSVTVTANDTTVVGAGTAFTKAKAGDVIQLVTGNNVGAPRLIEAVIDDSTIKIDVAWPQGDSAVGFEIRRGKSFTGVRGPFETIQGVVHG